MPTHKISAFPVGQIEEECCQQIDNWQGQSGDKRYQGHQITIGCFFAFVFAWLINKSAFLYHNCLYIFQIQLRITNSIKIMAIHGFLINDSVFL